MTYLKLRHIAYTYNSLSIKYTEIRHYITLATGDVVNKLQTSK